MTTPSPHDGPAQDAMPTTRGMNYFLEDPNFQFLCESVMGAEVYEQARPHLTDLGAVAGDELDALAAVADRNPPVLRAWDEQGRRVDEVVRHPAYRRMEEIAFSRFGLAAMAHRPGVLGWPGRAPQVLKYALSYLFAQSEFGLLCPVNMTDSCARMLGAFGS
ncbi:MAG TPA: DNA alkylation response protein, partial [Methylomirabilota bacterium]|nr:DNA alkylation response protein [Methylomirabilota bacterium]